MSTRRRARPRLTPRLRTLYAVAPGEFIAARDALARTLAAEGDIDAGRVRRLRRPTAPVWLLNAVARERPDLVEALLAAADALRRAQPRALAGHGAELREAVAAMHDAVAEVLAAARAVSLAGGRAPSAATLGQVERAARALATDPAARDALREAILDWLPVPAGAELLAGLSGLAVVPAGGAPAGGARPASREAQAHRAGAERAERAGAAARRRAVAHDETARRTERRREEAAARRRARAVAAAERAVRAAEQRVHGAEQRARTAGALVREATARLEEARRRLSASRAAAEDTGTTGARPALERERGGTRGDAPPNAMSPVTAAAAARARGTGLPAPRPGPARPRARTRAASARPPRRRPRPR